MKSGLQPPRWAERLLSWFCAAEVLEPLQGDLNELYGKRIAAHGKFAADCGYVRDVISSCRPFAFRKITFFINTTNMHKHTLLLVYRNFKRYKSSFFINLTGLSTGLACALLIYLWVTDEMSIDTFNEKDQRLYQVLVNTPDEANDIKTGPGTPGILADALADEIPEVEHAASLVPASWFSEDGILAMGEARVKSKAQYVGKDYFNMFTCDFIHGNKSTALADKYGVVISEEMAIKLFQSSGNGMGKSVTWMDGITPHSFQITGVFRNPPNTTIPAEILLNYELFLSSREWLRYRGNTDPDTYVLLREGADVGEVNSKIERFLMTKDKNIKSTLSLQRFSERYLHGRYENGVASGGRIEYVQLFSIIAVFILAIACINFMNLSTAKASRRLKEIGVKKAIGATRRMLLTQHFEESILMAFLSLFVALVLVSLLLPEFNAITGKHLHVRFEPRLMLSLLAITLFTGLVAGSYPALYLSSFRPVEVLKGKLKSAWGDLWIRKGLVVFQFAISVLLIVYVVVVYKQIDYVQSKNLGYNRDNIIRFEAGIKMESDPEFFKEGGKHEKQIETFIQQIRNLPGVIHVGNFEHNVTGTHGTIMGVNWKEGDEDEKTPFNNLEVGFGFIETMGIVLAEGRSFSQDRSNERSKVIINEASAKTIGLKDPVGKIISVWGKDKEIIGVAKDFHIESLFEEVRPCVIQLEPRAAKIMAKIKGGMESETIDRLRKIYEARNEGLLFDYGFIDDDYAALYKSEQRVSLLSRYFAGLAILISSLGLFGLAAFSAEKRSKEIGIRRILGSSHVSIVFLLSGDFAKMVLIAVVMALPVSFLVARRWLAGFAYHIDLEWWFFVYAAVIALIIPLITVGLQTFKVARINPVTSLKEE